MQNVGARSVTLAIVLVGLPLSTRAQPLELGLHAGGTSTSMSFELGSGDCTDDGSGGVCIGSIGSSKNRRSATIGVYAAVPVTRIIGVQADVGYVRKGYAVTQPALEVDYLEAPLLLRVVPFAWLVQPYAITGFSAAIRLSCRMLVNGGPSFCRSTGLTKRPTLLDFGTVYGIGVRTRLRTGWVSLEVRETGSINDIGAWDVEKSTNHVTAILLRYSVLLSAL